MTKKELMEDMQMELTFSRSMPYSLPEKELSRIIDIATKYFWDNWRYAFAERYLFLPLDIFKTDQFKKFREIKLPDCVRFVSGLKEIKGHSVFGTIDRDFSEQKFVGSEIFLTPFMGESIVYRTTVFSFLDLTKALIIDTIAYRFTKNGHKLSVIGRDPVADVVATCLIGIPEEDLYDDEVFQRYVRAKAKVRLGEVLTTFDYKLPGGVTINYKTMVEMAQKEMEAVLEQMKGENTLNYILTIRQ